MPAKTKARIRRRKDGMIELRRRRLRDDVIVTDGAVLALLLLGCTLFLVLLAAALVVSPVVLVVAAAFLLPFVWASVLARIARHWAPAPRPAPASPRGRVS